MFWKLYVSSQKRFNRQHPGHHHIFLQLGHDVRNVRGNVGQSANLFITFVAHAKSPLYPGDSRLVNDQFADQIHQGFKLLDINPDTVGFFAFCREPRHTRIRLFCAPRNVIEEIADPLIHLIRNAVDHGIESPDERMVLNKPAKGILHLSAAHEDNRVAITVKDDGAGISASKMKESAVDKGLITPSEAERMSDFEAVNLIFKPGFSTAKMVTDISGRGVGMDIVRNHIEKLNGTIDVHAELGKGTTFRIKLPLTLAIIPALLVGVGDQTFVVPMNSVLEIVRIQSEAIQSVKGTPVIYLRERVMPMIHLRDYFHLPVSATTKKYLQVVIVGVAQKRVALVVDELHGNQEIVKKSLGERVGDTHGVAGATILGDGHVGLILDITKICSTVVSL